MAVVVAKDMPAPRSDPRLHRRAGGPVVSPPTHVAQGGSVLTLFTNRRDMERVYEGLRPRLAAEGLDLACQERGTSPRRLRDRFMKEESLSLLALKSFWEGFDAQGDTLRCVVIPNAAFASPNDPLVREFRRPRPEERACFGGHLPPEAVISSCQGHAAGRLIRSASDSGVLVLADSRLATKRYGKTFIKSLPSKNVQMLDSANVRRYIRVLGVQSQG